VQSYFGSQLLGVLLRCIFGNSWWHMANHLPESAGITSRDLLAFFLFWLLEMPFLTVHPSKIKFLFAVSRLAEAQVHNPNWQLITQAESIICPLACVGVFAWCVHYGGGIRVDTLASTTPATAGGLGWAMMNGINSCLGVTSALLVNVSTRTQPSMPMPHQLTSLAATGPNKIHSAIQRRWVETSFFHFR
jgi:nucleobase:cation symporter-1, NCS1 family